MVLFYQTQVVYHPLVLVQVATNVARLTNLVVLNHQRVIMNHIIILIVMAQLLEQLQLGGILVVYRIFTIVQIL